MFWATSGNGGPVGRVDVWPVDARPVDQLLDGAVTQWPGGGQTAYLCEAHHWSADNRGKRKTENRKRQQRKIAVEESA